MDFNKFKKKLQDGVDSAKSKMQQIDTDAFKRQVDEKLCNAKAMAEGLGDSALGLGAKVAEGVGKGIDGLKAVFYELKGRLLQSIECQYVIRALFILRTPVELTAT